MNRSITICFLCIFAIVIVMGSLFFDDQSDESVRLGSELPRDTYDGSFDKKGDSGRPVIEKLNGNLNRVLEKKSKNGEFSKAKLMVAPSFDVVRLNPLGDAVIAGRAMPGSKVSLLDEEDLIAIVTADHNGEWVIVPGEPLNAGSRVLKLIAELPNGHKIKSKDVVVLVVPKRTEKKKRPLALLVSPDNMKTKKILQHPNKSLGGRSKSLTVDLIDYDESGNLRLLGQTGSGNKVIIYLNNVLMGQARVSADGSWELQPDSMVESGIHTLRVDELLEAEIVARIELPFSRVVPARGTKNKGFVIVQPGNSLWRISRRFLGEGTMFSVIYEANKDQIRDVNLIYPGQVFAVPKED